MTDCRAALEAIHDSLDGRLDPSEKAALDAHVASCAACARAAAELRGLRSALRSMPPAAAPSGFRDEVLARVASEPVGGGGRLLTWPRMLFPAAAAAALFAGAVILANRGDETSVARAPESAAADPRGAGFADSRAGTLERSSGLTVEQALEGREARDKGAAGEPAAPTSPPAPGAPAPAVAPAAARGSEAKSADSGPAKEARPTDATLKDSVRAETAAPRTRVVVFRTDAEAQAFLAALARSRTADDAKPGGAAVGGRGAPASGAAKAPTPEGRRSRGATAATAAQEERAAHVAGRAEVRGDAWLTQAASAGGRIVEVAGAEVSALDRGDPVRFLAVRESVRKIVEDERLRATDAEESEKAKADAPAAPDAGPNGAAPPKGDADAKAPVAARGEDAGDAQAILVVVVPDVAPEPPPAGGAK